VEIISNIILSNKQNIKLNTRNQQEKCIVHSKFSFNYDLLNLSMLSVCKNCLCQLAVCAPGRSGPAVEGLWAAAQAAGLPGAQTQPGV